MGTKNLLMLKTRLDSIKTRFADNFVYGNMLWAVSSLRFFICNYVLYSFRLILHYIFRIQIGDGKNELSVQFEDSHIDGFREELTNFLFQSDEYVYEDSEERAIENSALMESFSDFPEDNIKGDGEGTDNCVSVKADSNNYEDREEEIDFSVSSNEEGETELSASMKTHSDFHDGGIEETGTESSVLPEVRSRVHEDCNRRLEGQKESLVTMEDDPNVHENTRKREEEEEEEEEESERSVFMEGEESEKREDETEGPALVISKCQFTSGRDFVGFIEEPTTMTFSFREFYVGPRVSVTEISELKTAEGHVLQEDEEKSVEKQTFPESRVSPHDSETGIAENKSEEEPVQEQSFPKFHASPSVSETEISEFKSEGDNVLQEEEKEESVQEQRIFHGRSSSDQFSLKSEIFLGRDSSDEDDLDFNDNSFESDSESESSSSSGLIWGNSDKTDDLITYDFLAYQNAFEGLESEGLKLIEKLRAIDDFIELAPDVKNLSSWDTRCFSGKAENYVDEKKGSDEEEKVGELDSEEEEDGDEDDFEWEEDELVEQMKMELRNARQGGLPTILEDEEEEDEGQEERESPKVAEDLKPLKIEEKLEFKDHIREIQKVHKSYEDKMRKLDILNYQTLHALGLRQLKEATSTKRVILKNSWARKGQKKKSSEAVVNLVEELEMVYVGQLCLSWEILCWQYKKAEELKQYDSEWVRQYNVVAGEFQLFQVLVQRFIENEPFQGPRIHNYVRNRCVIRNLLQVPPVKDDSMKDKNTMKRDEEDVVSSEWLAEIIKESMQIFWKFVRADKEEIGNAFFKVSHQNRTAHLKDPAVSNLLTDIQTHLHKKEKKLKDIVRSGNCIVRRFQKQNEDKVELDHEQLVAQVQLRLISRVLSMSKFTKDQLIWCNEKLKRITFVHRKIQVEPSFLLFPF